MNTEQIRRIETMMGRALNAAEKERLGRIQTTLGMADNDALWDVLAALEYQRTFYDDLPRKITATSTAILEGITTAAEKEAAAAQVRLTDSVVKQAQRLSMKINYATLLPMGMMVLVCMMLFGSLLLSVGVHIGSAQMQSALTHGAFRILRMPSGVIMGGIALAGGLCLGVRMANEFAEGDRAWKKKTAIVLAMLIAGGVLTGLGIM